jgi:hypothetical protein
VPNHDQPHNKLVRNSGTTTVAPEMTVLAMGKGKKVTFDKNTKVAEPYFDKSSTQISKLVYKIWFSRYIICNNGIEFKLHFPYEIHMG